MSTPVPVEMLTLTDLGLMTPIDFQYIGSTSVSGLSRFQSVILSRGCGREEVRRDRSQSFHRRISWAMRSASAVRHCRALLERCTRGSNSRFNVVHILHCVEKRTAQTEQQGHRGRQRKVRTAP